MCVRLASAGFPAAGGFPRAAPTEPGGSLIASACNARVACLYVSGR